MNIYRGIHVLTAENQPITLQMDGYVHIAKIMHHMELLKERSFMDTQKVNIKLKAQAK